MIGRVAGLLALVLVVGIWVVALPPEVAERRSKASAPVDETPLEFFNRMSGTLNIVLTEPPVPVSPKVLNKKALPTAKIKSLWLEMKVWEDDEMRPLTEEEATTVALRKARVRLRGLTREAVFHEAPNGKDFTVRELWIAVEETERQTRSTSKWFGGIDVHHIYFEGLRLEEDGSYSIEWGS